MPRSHFLWLEDGYIVGICHNGKHGRRTCKLTIAVALSKSRFCLRFNCRMTGDHMFLRLTSAGDASCGVLS